MTRYLEELRSEKALLLQKFEYAEDAGAEEFRKDIATMETGLKKLEAQEQKYSAELNKALAEYAELKAQAADIDPVKLYEARQGFREETECTAIDRLQSVYGERCTPMMLLGSKRDMANLLNEEAEERPAWSPCGRSRKCSRYRKCKKRKAEAVGSDKNLA